MASILQELAKPNSQANSMKKYTTPKIYHGGSEYDLSKRWYVYYSYLHPTTGKMAQQPPVYHKINQQFKTKKERLRELRELRDDIERLLKKGFTPYAQEAQQTKHSAQAALAFALSIKKNTLKETSYKDYDNRVAIFSRYLDEKHLLNHDIKAIDKRVVMAFLNNILSKSSARNRNNTKTVLSALFSVLEDNEIIERNFFHNIKNLHSKPTRNKAYTQKQADEIFDWLKKTPTLLLFIKFVAYGFLRPIEVCRLKVGDINFDEKTLTVRAKNKALKTKTIPNLLLAELEFLKDENKEHWIFTPEGVGSSDTTEKNRRDYFSKQFLKVKKKLNLEENYTMYSFRHTFTTKVYRELRKQFSPHQAKSELMLITGHSTMTALEKYLRDIDAELPEDYSAML